MALDPKELNKPFRKLRKLVKKMRKRPTSEQVHDLRTNTRRVEATLKALQLDRKRKGKRVLKILSPMRKRAGKVRDMDVLTGFASGLSRDGTQEAVVQVLETLGETRFQTARKLHRSVANRRRVARKYLKGCASMIDQNLNESGKRFPDEWRANATADALELSSELAGWPQLTARNLHPFRIKVKELRNVLKLAGDDGEFADRLGEVKDSIGEWHDWTVLSSIAKDSLKKSESRSIVQQIDNVAMQKQQKALELSKQLRNRYFSEVRRNGRGKSLRDPVLKSAAKLAQQEHR